MHKSESHHIIKWAGFAFSYTLSVIILHFMIHLIHKESTVTYITIALIVAIVVTVGKMLERWMA